MKSNATSSYTLFYVYSFLAYLVSGILSYFIFDQLSNDFEALAYSPGLIFGLAILVANWKQVEVSLVRKLIFLVLSVVAFTLAFYLGLTLFAVKGPMIGPGSGLIGGGVIAAILFLLYSNRKFQWIRLTPLLSGAIGGFFFFSLLPAKDDYSSTLSFVIWQILVGMNVSYILWHDWKENHL